MLPPRLGITLGRVTREQKVEALRRSLAKYRGGRFETSGSGGASGMMFFVDREGRTFYIGGFKPQDAVRIAEALNLTLELLAPTQIL